MNEKIIIANDESKKVIIDTVMENTIYNIICEAVYGEVDLSEKQRIYFFLDKNTSNIINSNANNEEEKKVNKENNEIKKNEKTNNKANNGNEDIIEEEEKK